MAKVVISTETSENVEGNQNSKTTTFCNIDMESQLEMFGNDYEEIVVLGRRIPVFRDTIDDIPLQYKLHQRKRIDLIAAIPCITTLHFIAITRFNLLYFGTDGFFLDASIAISGIALMLFYIFSASHLLNKYYPESKYANQSKKILRTWFYGYYEDFLSFISTLSLCFLLIARVHKGQCESMTDIWRYI